MGEWFLEFQIACAKSDQVMQKKKTPSSSSSRTNSPRHAGDVQIRHSNHAYQMPNGNILDDDNFDTIRFCDTLPPAAAPHLAGGGGNAGVASSSTGIGIQTAVRVPVLPRSLMENVPISALYSQSVSIIIMLLF